MAEPCQFCGEPVYVSKQDYRTQELQKDGVWVKLVWHTACDPFEVKVKVEYPGRMG